MMTVSIEPELHAKRPELLFELELLERTIAPYRSYDVMPDGRFVMIQPLQKPTRTQVHVVLNWFEELKRLAPTP